MTVGWKNNKNVFLLISILLFECLLLENTVLSAVQRQRGWANFYEIYIIKAITNDKIRPNTFPVPGSPTQEIRITACRGQYEPASFVVHAAQKIMGLRVTATDLHSGSSAIPAGAIDIRVVKCWFQSGVEQPGSSNVLVTGKRLLTPELLLKDDKLIRVDLHERQNYLRTGGLREPEKYVLISGPDSDKMNDLKPRDAETLRPVDLEAATNKQFWVLVQVPGNAGPGNYHGKIHLTAANAPTQEIVLRLRVLPFVLEKPALRYAIYYRGKLTSFAPGYQPKLGKGMRGVINSEWKTPPQYLAEMRDLQAHGVDYPTLYQGNPGKAEPELVIRARADLPQGPLFTLVGTGDVQDPQGLEKRKQLVKRWVELGKKYGYDEVYFYGMDEATGEKLIAQRAAWNAVHEAGGKVFAASFRPGLFEAMGDWLDLAVLSASLGGGIPNVQEAKKFHQLGRQVYCYAFPQTVPEEPETFRRHYGLILWKTGYDGAMPYAYQHSFNHIWNDFDHQVRDHVFAYPTVDGVIDTVQWEGFRAGVDDIRYLTTLLHTIQKAKRTKPQAAAAAQKWVDNLEATGDLDGLRAKMSEWILKLQ
jgi:hypothetical protein